MISDKNRDELNRLIVEANTGWHLAIEVNKNSNSQLEYAEMVYEYTKELHNDSLLIKELIQKKHTVFEHNLQIVTIVTVLISVKFKNFLESVNTIQQFKTTDENRSLLNDLQVLHDITCKEIRGLLSLNLDMTNASHLNNETETKSIELTNKEIELFESLKKEVEYITEATRFSINGSYKNISNGQLLEKSLKEIVSNI